MSLYESLAARLIGTPLQRPAEWLRGVRGARFRKRHPELSEWFQEGPRTDRFLSQVIANDTNCIDIGCHIGSFLQKITTLAPAGRHYAVEPVPHKAANLRHKFPAVTVLEMALGDTNGTAEFFINAAQTSYSGLKARAVPGALQSVEVQCRKLDDAIPADAAIGFIKIDVNGAESMVLRGALGLLRRDRPALLLECTQGGLDDYGVDSDEVFDLLVGEAGYRVQLLKDYPQGPLLDAARFRSSMQYPFQAFNFAVTPAMGTPRNM